MVVSESIVAGAGKCEKLASDNNALSFKSIGAKISCFPVQIHSRFSVEVQVCENSGLIKFYDVYRQAIAHQGL
jgi:hypothetical protein